MTRRPSRSVQRGADSKCDGQDSVPTSRRWQVDRGKCIRVVAEARGNLASNATRSRASCGPSRSDYYASCRRGASNRLPLCTIKPVESSFAASRFPFATDARYKDCRAARAPFIFILHLSSSHDEEQLTLALGLPEPAAVCDYTSEEHSSLRLAWPEV